MSQRHFGRPLARERPPDLALAVMVAAATVAAVLIAHAIRPDGVDALTARQIAAVLAAPAVTALLFGGFDGWKLLRQVRRAEAAGSVTPPEAAPAQKRRSAADSAGVALAVGVCFTGVSALGGAALCIGVAAIIVGRECGSALVTLLMRRYERRLGRRYFKTVGEPEKVVWLGASGLE
jgi:hypothetical protein